MGADAEIGSKIGRGSVDFDSLKSIDLSGFLDRHYGIQVKGGSARCPFHDDDIPSMSVSLKGQAWVWHCHACGFGGSIIDFVMRKEDLDLKAAALRIAELEGLYEELRPAAKPKPEIVRTHSYTDEQGAELWQKVKLNDGSFRCRHKGTDGKWVYNLIGVRRVPYRLHEIRDKSGVIICEGERDSDTLAALGYAATSGPSGKDSWPDEITPIFTGKECRIIYDVGQDDAARAVARKLTAVTQHVFILRVPLEEHESDITDYLGQFETEEAKRDAFFGILAKEVKFEAEAGLEKERERQASVLPGITNPFLNRYVEHLTAVTDASPLLVLFSGIALLSGVLNKCYFMYPRRTNLNLYILLLAPSTYYRKSTTTDVVADYIRAVNPDLMLPDSFTPEALYDILKKYPRGLIIWRELIQVKEFQLGSEYNRGLSSFLVDMYDYKEQHKRWTVTHEEQTIDNPIVSILSAGIATWFVESLKQKDFQGGIWTRFIFVPAPEQEREFALPRPFVLDEWIKHRLHDLDIKDAAEIDISPIFPLLKIWGREHVRQVQKMESDLQAVYQRLEVMLIKLACLFQLATDNSTVVTEAAFRDAVSVIEYIKARLPAFFRDEVTFTHFEKCQANVLKLLRKRGKMSRTEILKGTRIKSKDLDDVLKQLGEEDVIEEATIKGATGRSGKTYNLKDRS